MAALSAECDSRAFQAPIDQLFTGNGALIERELDKSKGQAEICNSEGAKMAAMQDEMIKQIVDGQNLVSVAVSEANTTRDVIQGSATALNPKMGEIDDCIKFGEQRAQTSLGNLKGTLATLITEFNAKFADTNRESETKFAELNKNLLAW